MSTWQSQINYLQIATSLRLNLYIFKLNILLSVKHSLSLLISKTCLPTGIQNPAPSAS